jgi:hypothetical protein
MRSALIASLVLLPLAAGRTSLEEEHKDWWGSKVANMPQDVDAALMSEAFHTQALATDAAIEPMPECRRIWREAVRKAEQALAAYVASKLPDKGLSEQSARLEQEGDAASRQCFAERAKSHRSFAALTRQAQGLVDPCAGDEGCCTPKA